MQTFVTSEKSKSVSAVTVPKNKQQSFFAPVNVLPKLTIGAVGDPYEREADAMADRVMRMPDNQNYSPNLHINRSAFFSPKPDHPYHVQLKCAECEKEVKLQMKSEGGLSACVEAPSIVHDVINSGGQPLDRGTRNFFESRFGHDFSDVKVHTDSVAAKSAQLINALAYTSGSNIVFNNGQYSPDTQSGKRLLGHELAHTIQQRKGRLRKIQRFSSSCRGMLNNPVGSLGRILTGTAIHSAILTDFVTSVSGGLSGFGIPGASAASLRTAGLCGEDIASIAPQIIGGMAGMGYPDLARRNGTVMEVAEIKPASWNCIVDGIAQLAGYIQQGNATDPSQVAWRTLNGISIIIPMSTMVYPGKTLIIGSYTVQIEWCSPGLLVYQVIGSSNPVPVPVPSTETQPSPVLIRQMSGWDRVSNFAEEAIRTGATSSAGIQAFLSVNPDLINLIIGIGIAGLVATFAENIVTVGAGILGDLVTVPFFAAMIRIAMQMRPA